jgi:hypothetical protein
MSGAAAIQEHLAEFFTLRQTERALLAIPAELRESIAVDAAIAVQKREAAETLWPRGNMAEALRLARESKAQWEKAFAGFPEDSVPPWALKAKQSLAEATTQTANAPSPRLERDVCPEDENTFRTLVGALLAVEAVADKAFVGPGEIARMRVARGAGTVAFLVTTIAVLAWLLHKPMFAHATASASSGPDGPENAIDGNVHTAWNLPGSTGWIDITLGKSRPIRNVLLIGDNPPFGDRASKDIELDALMNGAVVKTMDFTFNPPPAADVIQWTTIHFDAPKCDHLRILVKSNYKVSGSIAEVKIE